MATSVVGVRPMEKRIVPKQTHHCIGLGKVADAFVIRLVLRLREELEISGLVNVVLIIKLVVFFLFVAFLLSLASIMLCMNL